MKHSILTVFLLLNLSASVFAEDGLQCEIKVNQFDRENSSFTRLMIDTVTVQKGVRAVGMFLAFSLELEVTELDSNHASFIAHVVTIGSQADIKTKKFKAEYDVPARISGISGKLDTEYDLIIKPLKKVSINSDYCAYPHNQGKHFKFDPSAHLDLHYVENTFGDFYWNSIKGMMETEYRRFRDLNQFTLPGKYNLYLCPCRIPSVIWDDRFNMVVDPTHNTMFTICFKEGNTTHPFVILHASILKNYGYAPPLLSEGFAGYLSDATWAMKEIKSAGDMVPLRDLLDTDKYLTIDPYVADRSAATLMRYLLEKYNITNFLEFYKQTHDLNIEQSINDIYGLTIDSLEADWKNYIDTVTVRSTQLLYYADLSESIFDYKTALKQGKAALELSVNKVDSALSISFLVRANYYMGNYYEAINNQQLLLKVDTARSLTWMALGSYQMMAGDYESAKESIAKASTLDTIDQAIDFNLAVYETVNGDIEKAKENFHKIITAPRANSPQAETRIYLAQILQQSNTKAENDQAKVYYREAIDMLSQVTNISGPSPQQQMWLGIASAGIGDTGAAEDHLQMALFLETREFFKGMIKLWLGKNADLRGERDVALDYYNQVLSSQSAVYHQTEAKKYLSQEFTIN